MKSKKNDYDLIMYDDGVPYTTSLIISNKTGVKHKNVIELIHKNLDSLEKFGMLILVKDVMQSTRGQKKKVYYLNIKHAAYMLMLMRGSTLVKHFKRRMIQRCFDMSDQYNASTDKNVILNALIDSDECAT